MNEETKPPKPRRLTYSLILIALTGLYVGLLFMFQSRETKAPPSDAIQEFRQAEANWQDQMSDKDAMEAYVRDHPLQATLFNFFSLLILVALVVGFILDICLLFRKKCREKAFLPPMPPGVNWSIGMLCRVVILWLVISIGLSLLFAVFKDSGPFNGHMNFLILAHTTIMDFGGVLLILWALSKAGGSWRDLGFRFPKARFWTEVKAGLLGYLAVLPIFFLILLALVIIAKLIAYEPPAHPLVEIFLEEEKRAPAIIVYSVILGSIVGPVIEEFFFRGFCYPIIKTSWGRGWALFLTSLFFAFIHQNEFAFLPIFMLGMGLALVYEARQNIVAPITMHIFHNSFFMTYFFSAKQIIMSTAAS